MKMLEPGTRRDRRFWLPSHYRKHGGLEYYDDAVVRRTVFVIVVWLVALFSAVLVALVTESEGMTFSIAIVSTALAWQLHDPLKAWITAGADGRAAYEARKPGYVARERERKREEAIRERILLTTDDPKERESLAKLYDVRLDPHDLEARRTTDDEA